jgi:hypothetical protein
VLVSGTVCCDSSSRTSRACACVCNSAKYHLRQYSSSDWAVRASSRMMRASAKCAWERIWPTRSVRACVLAMAQDLRRIMKVFLPLPIFWALYYQQNSTWVDQGSDMNTTIVWNAPGEGTMATVPVSASSPHGPVAR